MPRGVPEHVLERRGDGGTRRAEGAAQQRLDGEGSSGRGVMPDRPVDDRGRRPRRLTQTGPREQPRHGLLPDHPGHGLDHPTQHAPADVRVGPVLAGRRLAGDLLHQPGQGPVVVAAVLVEPELQGRAQRYGRAVRQEVAKGRGLRPRTPPQFRNMSGHLIVQGQVVLGVEDRQRRGDHRLGERTDREPGGRRHRAPGSHVCHAAVRRDPLSVPDHPECHPGNPVCHRMLLEKDGKHTLVHGPSVVRVDRVLRSASGGPGARPIPYRS